MAFTLWVDNDTDVWVNDSELFVDRTEVTSYTLELTIYTDTARTSTLSGAVGLAFTHQGNGDYRTVVPGTVGVVHGTKYYGRINDTGAFSTKVEWEPVFIGKDRVS